MQGTFTKKQKVMETFVRTRLIRPEFFPAMFIGGLPPSNEMGSNASHKLIAEASYFCYRVFLALLRDALNVKIELQGILKPFLNNSECPECITINQKLREYLIQNDVLKGNPEFRFSEGAGDEAFQSAKTNFLSDVNLTEDGFKVDKLNIFAETTTNMMEGWGSELSNLRMPVFAFISGRKKEVVWMSIDELVRRCFDDDIYSETPDAVEKILRTFTVNEPIQNLTANQNSRVIARNILVEYINTINTAVPSNEGYLVFVNLLAMIRNLFFFMDSASPENYALFKTTFNIQKATFFDEPPLQPHGRTYVLQSQYASLVKGNLTNSSMSVVWQPTVGGGIDTIDQEQFSTVMWSGIEKFVTKYVETNMRDLSRDKNTAERAGRRLAERIAMVRSQMKDIWYRTFQYSVSSEVNAIEHDIVQRAEREMNKQEWNSNDIQMFINDFLRMDRRYKNVFAAAVGKRLLTQRLISRGRTSIMEHHRSVNWAESAYQVYRRVHQEARNNYQKYKTPELDNDDDLSFGTQVPFDDTKYTIKFYLERKQFKNTGMVPHVDFFNFINIPTGFPVESRIPTSSMVGRVSTGVKRGKIESRTVRNQFTEVMTRGNGPTRFLDVENGPLYEFNDEGLGDDKDDDADDTLKDMNDKIQDLFNEIEALKNKNDELERENEQMHTGQKECQLENEMLQNQIEKYGEELRKNDEEKMGLKSQLKNLEFEIMSIRTLLELCEMDEKEALTSYQKDIEELKNGFEKGIKEMNESFLEEKVKREREYLRNSADLKSGFEKTYEDIRKVHQEFSEKMIRDKQEYRELYQNFQKKYLEKSVENEELEAAVEDLEWKEKTILIYNTKRDILESEVIKGKLKTYIHVVYDRDPHDYVYIQVYHADKERFDYVQIRKNCEEYNMLLRLKMIDSTGLYG